MPNVCHLYIYIQSKAFVHRKSEPMWIHLCTPLILPDSFLHGFFSGKKQMKRLGLVGFFYFLFYFIGLWAQQHLNVARGVLLIPETVVYPWREWLEGEYFFQGVLLHRAERSRVWGVLLLLFSLIFLICLLSAFLKIHLKFPPPLLAEEKETRLSSVSWHPKKYKSRRKRYIFFFASRLRFSDLH